MDILLLLFIIYTAFSIVATSFYLWHCGFSKDDLFVLKMDRVEQVKFVYCFWFGFLSISFYLFNFVHI